MTLEIDILAQGFGVKMTTINITENIVNAFTSHGEEEYPHECCGFIIGNFKGNESYGLEYLPASNIKEENRELLNAFYSLCRDRSENEYLKHSAIATLASFPLCIIIPFNKSEIETLSFISKNILLPPIR